MTEEQWRPVPGYEGLYVVSNLGRVQRVARTKGVKAIGAVFLTSHPNIAGYPRVALTRDGVCKRVLVHRLVAAAFIGPCPAGREVHHIDNNRCNPAADNLMYVSRSENIRFAIQVGRNDPRGEQKPGAKLTEDDVRLIRASNESQRSIARRFGVGARTVVQIKRRNKWAHVA